MIQSPLIGLRAAEVYIFSTEDCQLVEGFLIYVDRDQLKVLRRSGQVQTLKQDRVKNILVYDVDISDLGIGKINHQVQGHLKKINYLDGGKIEEFIGLPIKFVEEISFFYTTEGKIRIIDEGQIDRIDEIRDAPFRHPSSKSQRATLLSSAYLPHCKLKVQSKGIRPSKIISDLVKISEFLSNFQNGLESLEKFQDRTHLYARPFYYDQRPMLGIVLGKEKSMFFQWSNGSNYYFQSETILGSSYSDYAAHNNLVMGVKSRAKSHFLNISFEANFNGMPGGEGLRSNSELVKELKDTPGGFAIYPEYNHLFLLGGDYENFTLKFGGVYSNTALIKKKDFAREILAIKSSPIVEFGYTHRNWLAALVVSKSSYQGNSDNVTTQFIPLQEHNSSTKLFEHFKYKSKYFKLRGEYDLTDIVRLNIDLVNFKGTYSETVLAQKGHSYSFSESALAFSITHRFGHYIQVALRGNFIEKKLKSPRFAPLKDSIKVWGGTFAFLF